MLIRDWIAVIVIVVGALISYIVDDDECKALDATALREWRELRWFSGSSRE
jgi:hypothetical protein